MRIAVVGVGAVGGVLGGLLQRAGHAVSFVARGDALTALRAEGLTVSTPAGPLATGPLAASADARDLGAQDLVVVAVKAWQVERLAPSLRALIEEKTLVVPVQNGVEAAEQLAAALGEEAVLGGICHVLAEREGAARVRYAGPAPLLTIGERARASESSARVERLAETLRAAGISAAVSERIDAALWSKLLFVEPLGSVGAVTRSPADRVRAIPETRAMLEEAMREVRAVAAGRGVAVPESAIAQALARVDSLPAGATASMHRDLVEGRPSELREQTGAVVRLGAKAGVARPVHDFLWASLLPEAMRGWGSSSPGAGPAPE
jgi:2-dehydropantoate 2-reductase